MADFTATSHTTGKQFESGSCWLCCTFDVLDFPPTCLVSELKRDKFEGFIAQWYVFGKRPTDTQELVIHSQVQPLLYDVCLTVNAG